MKCKYDRDNCQFLGDKEECAMCVYGIMGVSNYLPKEVPQNLPKADAYSLLSEVRAIANNALYENEKFSQKIALWEILELITGETIQNRKHCNLEYIKKVERAF